MKPHYARELEPNQVVTTTFLVSFKDVREKKSGDPYLALRLADRSGEVEAKMWDNAAEVLETFERGDFVRVKGLLQIFQNRPQLTVHKISRVDDREVDLADYFPTSRRDLAEMMAEFEGIISGLGNPHLKALLEAVFADPEIARRFRTAPAAKQVHHAWLGGLIEHVLSLAALARFTAAHYRGIDADLLLTGVILHDLGKIYELSYDRVFGYTSEGQLLGHILIGLRIIDDKLRQLPDFPPKLRTLVEHMVASHHGSLEFGSPKMPQFPEALLLHHLDNLDSKVECMRSLIERDAQIEGSWTGFNPSLERAVLKKDRYLAPEPEAGVTPSVSEAASRPVSKGPRIVNTQLQDQLQRLAAKD